MAEVERKEGKIGKKDATIRALKMKVETTKDPWRKLTIGRGAASLSSGGKGANITKQFTPDEDRFLVRKPL